MPQPIQRELPLSFSPSPHELPLLPARMINAYEYCPRLAYLEWVQGEWQDSGDTVTGQHAHRRVDQMSGYLPEPENLEEGETIHVKSLTIAAESLGLIAKLDLLETQDQTVIPVDYKKGKRPHIAQGAYDPERVQLCVQALILRENGYSCDEAILYYVESKERVHIAIDAALIDRTLAAIHGLRGIAASGQIPPPLQDSPKCPRCALVGICLPDEINYFQRQQLNPRPLTVAREDALPLYVQAYHAKIAKKGELLEVTVEDKNPTQVRLNEVSQVVIMGNVYLTTPCLQDLMAREIPITWHSHGGWFYGHSIGNGHKNVELRTAQYKKSFNESQCLALAQGLVKAKILNCRTLLRRNWAGEDKPEALLRALKEDAEQVSHTKNLASLLGVEGAAAARYFGSFAGMLKQNREDDTLSFDFNGRNRRPPKDPVNTLLSFAYALLTRTWTVTLSAVGFDPFRGFFHQPRYGRPALALDMMESFRPLLADSCVLTAINNGEVNINDFICTGAGVSLKPEGKKRFIAAFERRLSQEITHPLFNYKLSYRRLLELQARLLARHLMDEIPDYPHFTTR